MGFLSLLGSLVTGVAFGLVIGSRLAYKYILINGRYFPEPFIFLILFFLFYFFKPCRRKILKRLFKSFLIISIPLLVGSILYGFNFELSYRFFRPFVLVSVLLSFGMPIFSSALFTRKINILFLLFAFSFGFSSIIFGYVSTTEVFNEELALSLFGGARSFQPDIAPLIMLLSLLRLRDQGFIMLRRLPAWFFVLINGILAFIMFSYSVNRSTIVAALSIFLIYITTGFIRITPNRLFIKKPFLLLCSFLLSMWALENLSMIIDALSDLYLSLTPDQVYTDSSGFKWSRLQFIQSQFLRFLEEGSNTRAGWWSTFLSNIWIFILPHGFFVSQAAESISTQIGALFLPYDSAILLSALIFGIPILSWVLIQFCKSLWAINTRLSYNHIYLYSQQFSIATIPMLFIYMLSNDTLVSSFFGSFHLSILLLLLLFPLPEYNQLSLRISGQQVIDWPQNRRSLFWF